MSSLPPSVEREARNWLADRPVPLPRGVLPVGQGAIAEIKPHTVGGKRAGLDQLYRYRFGRFPTAPQWLVTYVALDGQGVPIRSGHASAVRVFARSVEWPAKNRSAHVLGRLYDLGTTALQAMIPFPRVDQPGFFGSAVEQPVRSHLYRKSSRRAFDRAGGSAPGPDARWHELAAFYNELSRLIPDPLFAEIAGELHQLTA